MCKGDIMGNFSIELGTKQSFSPVCEEELMAATFGMLKTLKMLSDSSLGLCECDVSCGALEWSGTNEERELVKQSLCWRYLYPLWLYAEQGNMNQPTDVHLDDAIGDLVKWLCAVQPISEYSGERTYFPILKVILKFFARLKIDFGVALDKGGKTPIYKCLEHGCLPVMSGWLPQVGYKHLTVVEVALLAGVSNIRTIRNAQYDKEKPLHFFKEGKKVLVEVETAKIWLMHRRGFTATKATNDQGTVH